ncbi:MAG: hypothetical protein SH809_14875 [Rhodothermales bacterium]|nr:hypothetical protein [Rhodothermales bacterium]
MNEDTSTLILLLLPLVAGGIIAALNSSQTNAVIERIEAWIRARQERASLGTGFFARYVFNPLLWPIVKFCDWTDGFLHQGMKNGARVAAALYFLGLWLLVLSVAIYLVVVLAIIALVIFIAAKFLGGSSSDSDDEEPRRVNRAIDHAGLRGKKLYSGSSWLSEELKGRVDEDGNIYRGSSWLSEEKIGRIDEDGNIYEGTSWLSETKVGRIAKDGTLHKGSNWFSEERVGRIDDDGNIHKGTNWLNEEKQGRSGD